MAAVRWLIRIHKWVALIVGLQILLWVAGGFVMSVIPIERVRGEHNIAAPAAGLDLSGALAPAEAARLAGLEPPSAAALRSWLGRTVYEFGLPDGLAVLVDAVTGERLSPIDEETAIAVARADYAGEADIAAVTFFPQPTWENRRPGPTWRVDFADGEGTRLYVSTSTGQIAARRNDVWRVYDFFWMLHIMDYSERSNFNHPLIIITGFAALISTIAGVALLFPWVKRMLGRRRRRA